jgi:hypothetical protein
VIPFFGVTLPGPGLFNRFVLFEERYVEFVAKEETDVCSDQGLELQVDNDKDHAIVHTQI